MAVLNPPKLPPMIINGTKTNKYVCTYKNIWNAEKKMSYRKSSGSVGKYIPIAEDGSYGEIIFNDDFIEKYPSLKYFKVFRRKGGKFEFKPIDEEQFTVEQRSTTSKLHGGATWVLNKVVSESPIGRALAKTFKERNLDKKILSLIYFLCINKDNALSNYEEFAECTWLPFSRPLKSYSISRLLKTITQEKAEEFLKHLRREFKKQYGDNLSSHTFYALDSTSISTYSAISSAEFGHNKDLVELPQTNVLLIVDQKTGVPVYFRNFDGNVPDVSTMRNTIADLSRMGIVDQSVVLVSDKGYVSTANIDDCLRNDISFIFNTKVNANGFARQLALENYNHLLNINNVIPFINQSAYSLTMPWKYDSFPVNGKRQYKRDQSMVHVHIYYDHTINSNKYDALKNTLASIRQKYNTEPANVSPLEKRYVDLYMSETDGRAEIDMCKFNEEVKLAGFRVLISDVISDPLECYIAYNERNEVEYAFNNMKARLNCNRTRVHSTEAWCGKLFIQILAAAVSGIIRNRLKIYNNNAKKDKTKYRIIYDSDTKIINKLHNIMMTKFKDGWYFDEIAGKKKELFTFLNVPVPSASQEINVDDGEELNDEVEEDILLESVDEVL